MPKLTPEAAARVLAKRRASDPTWWFFHVADDPHTAKQRATMQTKAPFRAVKAGSRAGKSTATAADIAATARNMHPFRQKPKRPLSLAILVPERKHAHDTWERKLLIASQLGGPFCPEAISNAPFIPKREVKKVSYDTAAGMKVPTQIEMKNGNVLRFFWTASPASVQSFEGGYYDWIWIDEGACSEAMLPSVYTRCADAMSSQLTPGYGGVTWSATLHSDKYLGYARFLEDCEDENKPDWEVFELIQDENPALDSKALDIIESGMTADQAAIRRHGMTAFDRLAVYPQFSPTEHVHESRIEPELTSSIYYLNDPGAGHAAGHVLVFFNQSQPTTMHVWKAWEAVQETYDTEARWVAEALDGRFLEAVVLDPNATRTEKRQGGFTSAAEGIKQALGRYGYTWDNGRIKRGYLLPERKSDELGSINSRKAGITDVRQTLDEGRLLFNPSELDGGKLAIKRMLQHRFKEGTLYRGMGAIVDKHTEIPDCIRYAVRWKIRWMDRGENPPTGVHIEDPELNHLDLARLRSARIAKRAMKGRRARGRSKASDL